MRLKQQLPLSLKSLSQKKKPQSRIYLTAMRLNIKCAEVTVKRVKIVPVPKVESRISSAKLAQIVAFRKQVWV